MVVAQEKVAELAAHVAGEKDRQLQHLTAQVEQLELSLQQKEEVRYFRTTLGSFLPYSRGVAAVA